MWFQLFFNISYQNLDRSVYANTLLNAHVFVSWLLFSSQNLELGSLLLLFRFALARDRNSGALASITFRKGKKIETAVSTTTKAQTHTINTTIYLYFSSGADLLVPRNLVQVHQHVGHALSQARAELGVLAGRSAAEAGLFAPKSRARGRSSRSRSRGDTERRRTQRPREKTTKLRYYITCAK